MKHDLLQPSIRVLYNLVSSVKNDIEAMERMERMKLWGVDVEKKREIAIRHIESRMLEAADMIGILPSKEQSLVDRMNNLRQENILLREALKDVQKTSKSDR
jgi:alpha-galactosidase/6-phospho-beta-glucosidase family protein